MSSFLASSRVRALRATTVMFVAMLVALLSGAVAVAAGPSPRPRAGEAVPEAVALRRPVPDGLANEQAWALAREERLAAARAAEAEASRAAAAEPARTPVAAPSPRRAVAAQPPVARPSPPVAVVTAPPAVRPSVVWPLVGAITGWYGESRGRSRHPGIDIDGDTGDPVVAAAAGTVAWAGGAPAGYGGYGTVVILDHGDGVQTLYAHLSAVAVGVGQAVSPGDRVGSVGSTGHSTGSHLHFEVRRGGVVTDPAAFLPPRP